MAITITNKALQEYTDYYQDPVNKYIRLYQRKLEFNSQDEFVSLKNFDISKNSFDIHSKEAGTVIPVLRFDPITIGKEVMQKDFSYYIADIRTARTVSSVGQTSSSDNQQQIGSLDLYLTWSDDDNSYIGNSTIDFDDNRDTLTIDVTP